MCGRARGLLFQNSACCMGGSSACLCLCNPWTDQEVGRAGRSPHLMNGHQALPRAQCCHFERNWLSTPTRSLTRLEQGGTSILQGAWGGGTGRVLSYPLGSLRGPGIQSCERRLGHAGFWQDCSLKQTRPEQRLVTPECPW